MDIKTQYQREVEALIERQVEKGIEKYGTPLDQNITLTSGQRIEHLEEELIDALMYCRHLDHALGEDGIRADDYQRAALRTAQADKMDWHGLLLNGVMGLCGEAGECIDIVKKWQYQGHELDRDKLKLELGDVAWYLAIAAYACDLKLSEVLEANVEKLRARYPDGFDKARSIGREE